MTAVLCWVGLFRIGKGRESPIYFTAPRMHSSAWPVEDTREKESNTKPVSRANGANGFGYNSEERDGGRPSQNTISYVNSNRQADMEEE